MSITLLARSAGLLTSVIRRGQSSLSLFIGISLLSTHAFAITVPTGFVDKTIGTGLTSPTTIAVIPGERVLAVQQNGIIKIIKNDVMLATNFYTAPNVDSSNERGCLGIVADPAFATNHFVYLYCTTKVGTVSRGRVVRLTEAADKVVAGSEKLILDLPDTPAATKWHQGGAMRFGADGKLFLAVGNMEDNPQPPATATSQNLASAFGKILRFNVDGTFPADNPYFNVAGAYKGNYAIGFRNPFVLDIQPGSGLIYAGDVGQGTYEEINSVKAAANYGWPAAEGPSTNAAFTNPVYAYSHGGAESGCAITGTAFYNPTTMQYPAAYNGVFFYSDFCNGSIRYFKPATPGTRTTFASGIGNPTNISISANGTMYYLARNQKTGTPTPGAGTVGKITYTGSGAPQISTDPSSKTVFMGTSVTFSAVVTGATSLQWQRNGSNIAGATSTSYTLASPQLSDSGSVFRIIATNAAGSVTSAGATLTVTNNQAPSITLNSPAAGSSFASNQVINFSATASDPEDGTLAGSRFSWSVDILHDLHSHPVVSGITGTSGSFTVPDFETAEAAAWLRITLVVTDSGGSTATSYRDIYPGTTVSAFPLIGTPVNGWGPYEVNRSNGEQGAADGRVMTMATIPYTRGLGVHAPSDIRFNLAGRCSGRFIADVGIDDEVGDGGTVVFQVFLDGVKAYDSAITRGSDLRKGVNIGVAGTTELRLVVTDGGDTNGKDHADWGAARVTGCSATVPASISALSAKDAANAADWSIQSNLQVGNAQYGDRAYTFTTVPGIVAGGQWIRTANDSRSYTANPTVTFNISQAADVFVAVDDRSAALSWMTGWTNTGVKLINNEATPRGFTLFRRNFAAGTVTLGPATTAGGMYSVVVK